MFCTLLSSFSLSPFCHRGVSLCSVDCACASGRSAATGPVALVLRDVTVAVPGVTTDPPLVTRLSLCLHQRDRVLVIGDNGCGKSSLLRTIAGLWPLVDGAIGRANNVSVMYLPQRSYVPPYATLRQQLLYGCAKDGCVWGRSTTGSAACDCGGHCARLCRSGHGCNWQLPDRACGRRSGEFTASREPFPLPCDDVVV